MLPNGRRLGAHLPLGSGMVRAADRAAEIGLSALQFFSDNPTSWRRRPTLPGELPAFLRRLSELGISPRAIHAPYVVNLASPLDDVFEPSVSVLANELHLGLAYGAAFVNVHIGSHRGSGLDAGIARLAEGIARVEALVAGEAPDVMLVLENGSGGGFGIGSTAEELALIDAAIVAAGVARDRFAFCLDTAHAWGAGYAIDTVAGVDDLAARIDGELGLDRLRLIHLNDSRSALGSGMDRHEHIGAGRIGAAGLARVIAHPSLAHAAYILETPGMEEGWDAVNVARVAALVEGRPLDPLPPSAFTTRSARGRGSPVEDVADEATDDAASGAADPAAGTAASQG